MEESIRISCVLAIATETWGSEEAAKAFLDRPHPLLQDRRPIDLIAESDAGAKLVIDVLGGLRHGSVA